VKFLIDNNLSPVLAYILRAAGHDVSADTDFGALLSRSGAKLPSVLLIRRLVGRRAAEQAATILANLPAVTEDLEAGAIVVLTDDWVRIRRLPCWTTHQDHDSCEDDGPD
jgi:predicted nuclease of predicted toxin-antitoxin system